MRLLRSHSIYKKCVDTYGLMGEGFGEGSNVGKQFFMDMGLTTLYQKAIGKCLKKSKNRPIYALQHEGAV